MKAELTIDRTEAKTGRLLKKGTVLDLPDAYKLVQNGIAIPADEECRKKCGMDKKDIEEAHKAADRIRRGIVPEDFDIFEAGLIDGYTAQGYPARKGRRVPDGVIEEFREKQAERERAEYEAAEGTDDQEETQD